jgi:hypothetical protein
VRHFEPKVLPENKRRRRREEEKKKQKDHQPGNPDLVPVAGSLALAALLAPKWATNRVNISCILDQRTWPAIQHVKNDSVNGSNLLKTLAWAIN